MDLPERLTIHSCRHQIVHDVTEELVVLVTHHPGRLAKGLTTMMLHSCCHQIVDNVTEVLGIHVIAAAAVEVAPAAQQTPALVQVIDIQSFK